MQQKTKQFGKPFTRATRFSLTRSSAASTFIKTVGPCGLVQYSIVPAYGDILGKVRVALWDKAHVSSAFIEEVKFIKEKQNT